MPSIDINKFQKSEEEPTPKEYTFSRIEITDKQVYIKEENITFDLLDLDFSGKGPGIEVLMSFIGEEFKMRVDFIPKEELDRVDLYEYLSDLVAQYKPCLECRTKLFRDICSFEGEKEEDRDEEA